MSANQDNPVIWMRDVSVAAMRDTTFTAVKDVNWSVAAGDFWVIAGQEHSGKSDLLMLAAGLMPPAAGSCQIFGRDPQEFGEAELAERLRVGFVFQGGNLFNRLTVSENIALPLHYHRDVPAEQTADEVRALLELMELTPLADVTPANIAPNWRQRVALARALVLKPELLLLDNPLAGLGTRQLHWWLRFLEQLSQGHEQSGGRSMTLVVTTDDLRPWQHARRKFALLRDKQFVPLGGWTDVETADDPLVKELLAVPAQTTL
jgi:ABC-type transporter Mla maintaining outer membrane lipid asymmetry ATPase subunit MlaF